MVPTHARPITRGSTDANRDPEVVGPDDDRESALTPYLPERWRSARLDPGRKGMFALGGVGMLVVVLAAWAFLRDAPDAAPVPALPVVQPLPAESVDGSTTAVEEPPATIVVSVVGLVVTSGLVHLPPGARVADALAAAGGPLAGADVLALNLAAKLADGDQIVVGSMPPDGRPVVSATVADGDSSGTGSPASGSPQSGKVDLNTATVADLDALPGVGPVTAANIVAWRDVNGPFADVGQLAEVDGIGPVRFDKLKDQVTV